MGAVSRRGFLAATSGLVLGAGVVSAQAAQRHNSVVLMSDEHNPFYSSVYGHSMVHTPNMARLAAMGTVFENTYCPSPLCMPCRSSLMSGQRVHAIQAYNNCNVFRSDARTMADAMGEQGVYTVLCGKTDVFRPGEELGFNETFSIKNRAMPGDENVSRMPLAIRLDGPDRADAWGPKDKNPFGGDDKIVDAAVEWLKTRAKQIDGPWSLLVHTLKPHFPHHVTQALWDRYPEGGDMPVYGREEVSASHPYASDLREHFRTNDFSEENIRGLRRGYLGCVTYTDSLIGRLLDALEQEGLMESTVFAYASDHGDMAGKFGMWWKCSLYEDSARVPLLMAGPGFAKGVRVTTPVDLHDMRASLFAAAGATQPGDWIGSPLQSIAPADATRVAFAEYNGHGTRGSGYLIRQGDWKLQYCTRAPHQLFNLAEDPHELRNVAMSNVSKRNELIDALRAICEPEAEEVRAGAYIQQQLAAMR